jgi:hypothetical protein
VLTGAGGVQPTFVVDRPGLYQVQLIVNDGALSSAADVVDVQTVNSAPVANAGADQSAYVGQTVTLDGSASTDVDGNALGYVWALTSRPAGSAAAVSDPTAVTPTFVLDRAGVYVAQLIVNDGTVSSAADTVTVTTLNSAPVANAGSRRVGDRGGAASRWPATRRATWTVMHSRIRGRSSSARGQRRGTEQPVERRAVVRRRSAGRLHRAAHRQRRQRGQRAGHGDDHHRQHQAGGRRRRRSAVATRRRRGDG